MAITRKDFLGTMAGGTVLLILQACGGGGDDDGDRPAMSQGCGASGGAIAGNHGHELTIPRADLDAMTDRSYNITGSANHPHMVTLTPTQLQALKAGQAVTVTSSTDASHDHAVTVSCA